MRLVFSSVYGDAMYAYSSSILQCETSKASACTNYGNILARARARFFEAPIDSESRAKNRTDILKVAVRWDVGDMSGFCDGILLEGSVDRVAG